MVGSLSWPEKERGIGNVEPFSLLRVRPLLTWLYILADWAWIVLSIALSLGFPGWASYLLAFVIIGSRQHAIAVHLHDATHYLLFRSRRWNDLVARALMEWPLFASLDGYRRLHRDHHHYLNTDRDPDWARNQPYKLLETNKLTHRLWLMSGCGVLGQGLAALFLGFPSGAGVGHKRPLSLHLCCRWLVYAGVFWVLYVNGWLQYFFWYWLVPYLFYFFPVMRFRGLSEHWAVPSTCMEDKARTVKIGWLPGFLLYPKNINYHVEHHGHPAVPFYYLPDLHRRLMGLEQYQQNARITHGVIGVMKELLFPGYPSGS